MSEKTVVPSNSISLNMIFLKVINIKKTFIRINKNLKLVLNERIKKSTILPLFSSDIVKQEKPKTLICGFKKTLLIK
ncbi:hypothetical protein BpHYR1_028108 [Brachionus plicatilis]|uniref:Uncharacterized protein n=1 Tax=Brachionus plicatilis TaxID=10195 RepID=A0A3M7R916_BRAPC|nr:hypothetical protein BpHYR1_028108 [Brachionus plicatilis]